MSSASVGLKSDGDRPIAGATRMRIQIFPVMATLSRLQELCDRQFNDFIPPSVAIFRPALPVVFVGILHYPDMGGRVTWETGSLSQNELYFLVPLERYRLVNGREELVELACTTPYIFVDNAESVATARERFGMPKELAEFSTGLGDDLPWDLGTQRYLRVNAFEPTANGVREAPLLDVVYTTKSSNTGLRDDDTVRVGPSFGPLEWFKALTETRELAERAFGGEPIGGLMRRAQVFWSLLRGQQNISLFSLRQFADPEDAKRARYSDLIAFRMKLVDLQQVNFLGEGPLRSQFQLRLRRSELRPISKLLGLRVTQRTSQGADGDQQSFEAIDAIAPFYAQADTDLVAAEQICWHHDAGQGAPWRDPQGNAVSAPVSGRFNTFLGPSNAAFLEPESEPPIVDLKYLMVASRRPSLERLVARLLPANVPFNIRVAGRNPNVAALRLLFSWSRPAPWHAMGERMWNDGPYLSIAIPIVIEIDGKEFNANFMIQELAGNAFTVQSMRALLAEPTSYAIFNAGSDSWFGSTRDIAKRLGVSTWAVEQSSSGATLACRPLLDVLSVNEPDLGAVCLPPTELRDLREEMWPLLSCILPSLSVGHIPDPADPECSLLDRMTLTTFYDEGIDDGTPAPERQQVIRFYDNDTFPIAKRADLLCLDERSPLGSRLELLESREVRTRCVPVIASAQRVSRVHIADFKVIWESAFSPRVRRP